MFYRLFFKRLIDIILSLVLLVFFFPLFLVLSLILFLHFKNYPFFLQKRTGLNGTAFTLYKFRTMSNKKDSSGNLYPDEYRLTKLGELLRSLSIDEIPQFFNVLKGDMSLIGPRPLLTRYMKLYNKNQLRRHEIRPGITGWSQVNGRNEIDWDTKFKMDVWYIDNMNFILDFKILCLTIKKVLVRQGIKGSSSATMKAFQGTKEQSFD